jgi:DNA-damage-inducible protein J
MIKQTGVIEMATAKANINVKIDANVKETAVKLLSGMGLDLTTAIDIYLRKVISTGSIPFQISAPKSLDEQLAEALDRNATQKITLPSDENGNMFIDKDKYPELYDWAVNG